MGAVTVVVRKRNTGVGAGKMVMADVTFSGSYGAGGDTYTNAQFEMDNIDGFIDCGAAAGSTTTGYVVSPDIPNKKLRLLGGAASGVALAETGTAGQTGTVQRLIAVSLGPYV
jgi:hypothetical protein